MKDFDCVMLEAMWKYTPAAECSCFRPIRCGKQWKNWQSKRPQTGRDFGANVKLM